MAADNAALHENLISLSQSFHSGFLPTLNSPSARERDGGTLTTHSVVADLTGPSKEQTTPVLMTPLSTDTDTDCTTALSRIIPIRQQNNYQLHAQY